MLRIAIALFYTSWLFAVVFDVQRHEDLFARSGDPVRMHWYDYAWLAFQAGVFAGPERVTRVRSGMASPNPRAVLAWSFGSTIRRSFATLSSHRPNSRHESALRPSAPASLTVTRYCVINIVYRIREVAVYGVSPAYFISRFGDRFSPEQVASALPDIRSLGYDAYQLEVFHAATLEAWERGGVRRVAEVGDSLGLLPSQFVAHFLLHAFENPEALSGSYGLAELVRVVAMLEPVRRCRLVTVPLPAFRVSDSDAVAPRRYDGYFSSLVDKISAMCEVTANAGFRLAVELMPGALISGSDGFLKLCDALGDCDLGNNFDTGHAWAQKEPVELIPSRLGNRISGTHLCDNDAGVNDSLAPGRGTIRWPLVVDALRAAGYSGSWDMEIKCEASRVQEEYAFALQFIEDCQ